MYDKFLTNFWNTTHLIQNYKNIFKHMTNVWQTCDKLMTNLKPSDNDILTKTDDNLIRNSSQMTIIKILNMVTLLVTDFTYFTYFTYNWLYL